PRGIRRRRLAGQARKSDLFGAQNLNFGQHTQDLEQLAIAVVQIRQNHLAFAVVDGLDNAQQQRNTDAIDQLGLFEVDYQISDPALQHFEASPFDPLAPQLIQVGSRIYNCGAVDESCPDFGGAHSMPPWERLVAIDTWNEPARSTSATTPGAGVRRQARPVNRLLGTIGNAEAGLLSSARVGLTIERLVTNYYLSASVISTSQGLRRHQCSRSEHHPSKLV